MHERVLRAVQLYCGTAKSFVPAVQAFDISEEWSHENLQTGDDSRVRKPFQPSSGQQNVSPARRPLQSAGNLPAYSPPHSPLLASQPVHSPSKSPVPKKAKSTGMETVLPAPPAPASTNQAPSHRSPWIRLAGRVPLSSFQEHRKQGEESGIRLRRITQSKYSRTYGCNTHATADGLACPYAEIYVLDPQTGLWDVFQNGYPHCTSLSSVPEVGIPARFRSTLDDIAALHRGKPALALDAVVKKFWDGTDHMKAELPTLKQVQNYVTRRKPPIAKPLTPLPSSLNMFAAIPCPTTLIPSPNGHITKSVTPRSLSPMKGAGSPPSATLCVHTD
ncbi:hypothetical protein CYMTET_9900 [Cymbomonas tetramitiformis]|uniref:Uncharacterized protein n=1 Tax=Cymbomonas tetramitiformis TaxID=36881 RepID=A0AAE0GQK6_9CHLO|nr:hypothetical protein CYMTET_9900 [Cymbomonas tetramitiformis]